MTIFDLIMLVIGDRSEVRKSIDLLVLIIFFSGVLEVISFPSVNQHSILPIFYILFFIYTLILYSTLYDFVLRVLVSSALFDIWF